MEDFIGLHIDSAGCSAQHPVTKQHCVKPAGHIEDGDPEHSLEAEVAPASPTCPDCGGEMCLGFSVEAEDEDTARRVFLSYLLLKDIPLDDLVKFQKGHHVQFVADEESGDGA